MRKIGENLEVSKAVILVNEDQDRRVMVKHGWDLGPDNSPSRYVHIVPGGVLKQVARDEEYDYVPLEGDYSSLWDVWAR